jgi:hypothetical protein
VKSLCCQAQPDLRLFVAGGVWEAVGEEVGHVGVEGVVVEVEEGLPFAGGFDLRAGEAFEVEAGLEA